MNAETIEKIRAELAPALHGRTFGKVFQLSRTEMAVDFRLPDSAYLYLNFSPADPRAFLIRRRLRDLERSSGSQLPFAAALRRYLSGMAVRSVTRLSDDRILEFSFSGTDEFGEPRAYALIAQLTGRSADLLLLDSNRLVINHARETAKSEFEIGVYAAPIRGIVGKAAESETDRVAAAAGSPSEALDAYYLNKAADERFLNQARTAQTKVNAEIAKRQKLIGRLEGDRAGHGNAAEWKRIGDLLLANTGTAKRKGSKIIVIDYYDEGLPEIEIEADENESVTGTAERYFKRYTKARNAAEEIESRLEKTRKEIRLLEKQKQRLDRAAADRDEAVLADFITGGKPPEAKNSRGKPAESSSSARSFVSSDGFEILVGKKAKDNDQLTFKIAKSLDIWMHAADYPGSHVVIRNPNRQEIPPGTLVEAAQLAAFYSQGKSQVKAAVHYTQKKFVNKPKGAAPGLVSLASFKTLLVEPKVPEGVKAA